jgi:hypothetical protein
MGTLDSGGVQAAAGAGWASMGLAGLAGRARARADWVGPQARPNPIDRFFFRNISQCKIHSGKFQQMFKGTENTQKISKIPGKFLETDYDMNNPNKAFGADEKDFRAF